MNDAGKDKDRVRQKLAEWREAFESDKESIRKELADSLAAADRDIHYLKQDHRLEHQELSDMAERMRLRASEFEAEHPKLSAIFREIALLLRTMGI